MHSHLLYRLSYCGIYLFSKRRVYLAEGKSFVKTHGVD